MSRPVSTLKVLVTCLPALLMTPKRLLACRSKPLDSLVLLCRTLSTLRRHLVAVDYEDLLPPLRLSDNVRFVKNRRTAMTTSTTLI